MTSETARPWVLVTGASGGIGLELACGFARDGHPLVLTARSTERLAAAAASRSVLRAVSTSGCPSRAKPQASSSPIPPEAPVTSTQGRAVSLVIVPPRGPSRPAPSRRAASLSAPMPAPAENRSPPAESLTAPPRTAKTGRRRGPGAFSAMMSGGRPRRRIGRRR